MSKALSGKKIALPFKKTLKTVAVCRRNKQNNFSKMMDL